MIALQRGGALRPEPPPINADRPGWHRGGGNLNTSGNGNTTEFTASLPEQQADMSDARLPVPVARTVAELTWRAA